MYGHMRLQLQRWPLIRVHSLFLVELLESKPARQQGVKTYNKNHNSSSLLNQCVMWMTAWGGITLLKMHRVDTKTTARVINPPSLCHICTSLSAVMVLPEWQPHRIVRDCEISNRRKLLEEEEPSCQLFTNSFQVKMQFPNQWSLIIFLSLIDCCLH